MGILELTPYLADIDSTFEITCMVHPLYRGRKISIEMYKYCTSLLELEKYRPYTLISYIEKNNKVSLGGMEKYGTKFGFKCIDEGNYSSLNGTSICKIFKYNYVGLRK